MKPIHFVTEETEKEFLNAAAEPETFEQHMAVSPSYSAKTTFAPNAFLVWKDVHVPITVTEDDGEAVERTCIFTDRNNGVGFIPLYDSLEKLQKDFPGVPYTVYGDVRDAHPSEEAPSPASNTAGDNPTA